jgi:uncharacterized membrane protein
VVTFVLAFVGTLPKYVAARGISVILTVLATIGFAFSLWLTSLELFVIHAICEYCVTSAVIVTLILIVSIADLQQHSPQESVRTSR